MLDADGGFTSTAKILLGSGRQQPGSNWRQQPAFLILFLRLTGSPSPSLFSIE